MSDGDLGLPLRPGDAGPGVRDLHERLGALGIVVGAAASDAYGPSTEAAVRRFQAERRLTEDGVCGVETWQALVEAGHRLGDRYLYLRAPMLRGDDVAELQRRLSALGFDPGHVDGIFGPDTEVALRELQRNLALTVDGVCGRDVLAALARLVGRAADGDVARARERARLRHAPPELGGRTVVVGDLGGLDALSHAVARQLGELGAEAVVVADPEGSAQAAAANALGADAYVGLQLCTDDACGVDYFAGQQWSSPGGEQLATILIGRFERGGLAIAGGTRGMSVPVLRETRMPAVRCRLGPPAVVVEASARLAAHIAHALAAWVEDPVEP